MPDINKNKILTKKRFWAGLLLAQFLLFLIFSKLEIVIKKAEYFFEIQKGLHQKLFSWVSFSVGDIFYIVLALSLFYLVINFKTKNRSTPFRKGLILLNILYFTYQIFWGLLYFQKPLIEKIPKHEPNLNEAKILALKYLEKCRQTRMAVKEDRNGVFKVYNQKNIEEEILKRQNGLPELFKLKKGKEINSFKPSLFSSVMSYTGIYGYYNPFTAEAQYNPNLPSSQLPFTLSHESAHQLGYAREQEASFIGYLIGINSENAELRYSTEYFVLKSLLNYIYYKDERFTNHVFNSFSHGMKRDRLYEKNFNKRHSGLLDAFFGMTNNLFLKSNQQDGSITYSYFTDLLLRYEKS